MMLMTQPMTRTTKMKAFPVLLLTFSLCVPATLSAPAHGKWHVPRMIPRETDSETTPVDFAAGAAEPTYTRPAATPFFTPAVFLDNYYDRMPTPTATPEPTPVVNEDVEFLDPPATDAQAAVDETQGPTFTSMATEPTDSALQSLDSTVTSLANEDMTAIPEPSLQPTKTSAPLSPTSIITTKSVHSTSISLLPQPTETHAATSESQQAVQSRKAAIIGTLLALGSVVALLLCGFCMRCRLPRSLPFKRGSNVEDAGRGNDQDPEKVDQLQVKSSNANLNVVTLPVLKSNASSSSTGASGSSAPQIGSDGQQYQTQHKQEWRFLSAREDGQFEDVTHILSEDTFAAHDSDGGSNRSSTSSAHGSISSDRQSRGANSVAQSYATCESRYSTPSIQEADESISEQTASFHSAPSPPESPEPETPKQQHTTRPRSKTLTQLQSPFANGMLSSSKSFPARYSNRSSAQTSWVSNFTEESEWDIAAAYGARYSKCSTGRPVSEFSPIAENMETVDIGGRSCILVQGVAF